MYSIHSINRKTIRIFNIKNIISHIIINNFVAGVGNKYGVSDFQDVKAELGTLADWSSLVDQLQLRNMKVKFKQLNFCACAMLLFRGKDVGVYFYFWSPLSNAPHPKSQSLSLIHI